MPFDSTDVQNIVKVTFMVNTATAPDTVMGDHYVGVFGAISGPNGAGNPYLGQTVDWNNSTDIVADIKVADTSVYHRHTVKSGETLGKIAKQYYDDASKYQKIFAANTDILKNPDLIHPNQELIIPNL